MLEHVADIEKQLVPGFSLQSRNFESNENMVNRLQDRLGKDLFCGCEAGRRKKGLTRVPSRTAKS
ncbi:hypothetical protein D623_10026386 [Myotis brandtii]|uniref:Uncharacterized protein n=1 Tax=Myotis brandtii TaxID=109478 RepID=S7PC12_MYOBR|nr:hypothetical protein D623_10026386 [Myotis brandtii]